MPGGRPHPTALRLLVVLLAGALVGTLGACEGPDGASLRLLGAEVIGAYPGARIDLVLAPSAVEVGLRVVLEGRFVPEGEDEGREVAWEGAAEPPVDGRARLSLPPDALGIAPGDFEGRVEVFYGEVALGEEPVVFSYGPPVVEDVAPAQFRRGQWVALEGAGFVVDEGTNDWASYVLLAGQFERDEGGTEIWEGESAVPVFPDDATSPAHARFVARSYFGLDGEPDGLGAHPGRFSGTAQAVLAHGAEVVQGEARPFSLEVLPPRQLVYLRFLDSFDEALERFGLRPAREEVVGRILEVCYRDYADFALDFVVEEPVDFAEYTRVDILGTDPNRAGLLGLDNTKDKDVGNLCWDDVVGGYNAESAAAGTYPYGGVFVASFLQFSPTLGDADSGMVSARFDDIFAAFVPELGGQPWDGEASDATAEAVRVLGNLVGSTVTHELGHALGLAAIEGEVHNLGDEPNRIMDAGMYRPFEERAELDGQGPAVFAPHNWTYLNEILPTD